jgi:peptide/nickel transport system substrate-binding protein
MSIRINRHLCSILVFSFALLVTSCGEPVEIDIPITRIPPSTPTPTQINPTEMPPPPRTLVVCLGQEPASLYLYSSSTPETDTILQAIYDGPVDMRGFQYQPVILSKLPSYIDGDARVEAVTVTAGEIYLNPDTQQPDVLSPGKPYFPTGCSSFDCQVEFEDGEVAMDQLQVDYELLPDLVWSDGEPLTANDSIFSFNIDADVDTPTTKYLVHRTSNYEQLDDLHTRWTGIPGFIDLDFKANFWPPLPAHILQDFSASELLTADESVRAPIGWGPYIIERWEDGSEIVLRRSENYFRAPEGIPSFDLLRMRFLGSDFVSALEQVLTGECDVLDETVFSNSLWEKAIGFDADGDLRFSAVQGAIMQRIDFNLGAQGGTTIFSDVRMRRAFAACLDPDAIIDEALMGLSLIPETYLPPEHPFHAPDPQFELPTLDQAMDLLTEVGWLDEDLDPQTPRISSGVIGIPNGTSLQVTFFSTEDYFSEIINPMIEGNVSRCGISMITELGNPSELFEPWPNGPVFGGRFDLVSWAWPTFTTPPCEMFAGFEIPGVDHLYGINATGFNNTDYDAACRRIIAGGLADDRFVEAVGITESIFREELPAIPLYIIPRVTAFGKEICGPEPDPTTFSVLWNLEEFASGEDCIED